LAGSKRTFIVSGKRSPSAAQVARIERTRETGGKAGTETAYAITSLTAAEAGPERLLDLTRTHWVGGPKSRWELPAPALPPHA